MADDRKIIMAVDFGTAYSGLAWAQTRKPEIQTPVIQWPDATSGGLEGATSDKVPTELQYEGQNYRWGFQIPDFEQRHQWFKLGLDPTHCSGASSPLARDYPDMLAAPPSYDNNPEQMVTDYLTALRIHAEKALRWKLPQSALASTPIEFIITTPAVWSDMAQAKTRSCAQKAGMGNGDELHIISEPEAAAMYALDAMDPHNIKVGDTFVLCDAGGGTVDLISYKVSALKPILQISEAAPGSGSACGSTFLNRIFSKFLKDKLSQDPNWDEDVLEEAMKRFDVTVKRSFSGHHGEEYQIPVPGLRENPRRDVRRGRYRLTGSDVKTIFDPVVKEVISLVMGQISATKKRVKAVLLVDGFGIEVMQSPNGWTAVVRGALMKGLASSNSSFARVNVSGRKARKHYGLKSSKAYEESKHADISHLRYWRGFEGDAGVRTIDWYITKGETVEEDKPQRFPYYQTHPFKNGPPNQITARILFYSDPNNTGAPQLPSSEVKTLVAVTAQFGAVPRDYFPTATGQDGILYYKIQFEVQMTCYSAYTKYELIYNGVNCGPFTADFPNLFPTSTPEATPASHYPRTAPPSDPTLCSQSHTATTPLSSPQQAHAQIPHSAASAFPSSHLPLFEKSSAPPAPSENPTTSLSLPSPSALLDTSITPIDPLPPYLHLKSQPTASALPITPTTIHTPNHLATYSPPLPQPMQLTSGKHSSENIRRTRKKALESGHDIKNA